MPFVATPSGGARSALPPEPPPAPRPFRWGALDAGTVFLLLFGTIWTGVGAGITTIFTVVGGPLWNDLILDRRGKKAEAMPTSVDGTGSFVNGRRVFRVSYDFFDEHGQPRESAADTTDSAVLERADRRERLSIDYDPQAPALSRLTGGSASFFGWFTLVPLAFAVAGLLVLRAGLTRALRIRHLYVRGLAALARVTAWTGTRMRVNQRRLIRVEYEFDAVVRRVTGSSTFLNPPPVGSSLWVFYRPSDPTHSVAARGR
jgi:hypothetical protein